MVIVKFLNDAGFNLRRFQLLNNLVDDVLRVVHMQDFFPRKEKRRVTSTSTRTGPHRTTTRHDLKIREELVRINPNSREEGGAISLLAVPDSDCDKRIIEHCCEMLIALCNGSRASECVGW